MSVLERLKSPVVIIQLISLVAVPAVVYYFPSMSEAFKYGAGLVIVAINILAGLNNPTDRENF